MPLVLRAKMDTSKRASTWSLTINNPTEQDLNPELPAGWKLSGQIEEGEEGTRHYQAMLTTPQVRFSAVKKIFPRGHIEIARNKKALAQYVHKEESRIEKVEDKQSNIMTLFQYQHVVAQQFNDDEYEKFRTDMLEVDPKLLDQDIFMYFIDKMVADDIVKGIQGIEYIAINPMWRSAWKKFGRQMIKRERINMSQTDRQTDNDNEDEELLSQDEI